MKMATSQMDTVPSENYDEPVHTKDTKCGIDMEYARNIHGLTKLAQVLLSLLAFCLCAFISAGNIRAIFLAIVTFIGFFLSTIHFFAFATPVHESVTKVCTLPVNWYISDLAVSGIGVPVLFLFSMLSITSIFRPVILAASIVGFIDMAAFAVSTFFAFQRYRANKQRTAREPEYEVDY